VAILGGGVAALATAWRLSDADEIESVTVYQRGWRLGGKGASSRGPDGRIEEHGLHVWLGYYDNAFRMIRQCYSELDRPRTAPTCPIRTWRQALAPADTVGLATRTADGWDEWTALFGRNDELPGDPDVLPEPMSPARFVSRALQRLVDFARSLDEFERPLDSIVLSADPAPPTGGGLGTVTRRAVDLSLATALELARLAEAAAGTPPVDRLAGPAMARLDELAARLRGSVAERPGSLRTFELIDLVVASVQGILADGLLVDPRGFGAVNGEEYRDWLLRHGAAPATIQSPLVNGVYDLVFGYRDGDRSVPRFAAGTGLFLSAKMLFEYRTAMFWKMQAGMGDVVIAPLYQALRRRGVAFEFFHDLRDLVVADDASIDGVVLARQAALRDGVASYDPLVDVGGLPCFPSEPDGRQLTGLPEDPRLLETVWGRGHAIETVQLRRGVDVDDVVFAISIGMVPYTCRQLIDRDPRWRRMMERIGTVATQSVQLWFGPDEAELGWRHPGSTVTGYGNELGTVAAMSHLIEAEGWPDGARPGALLYLCGTLAEADPASPDDVDHPTRQRARVAAAADRFVEEELGDILPGGAVDGVFEPAALVGRYVAANVDPSDRYVQSLPGTDRFRLRPDASGFDHLYLAGDWTDCGINAGCIEAAVVSGLQAANAVLGRDRWAGIGGWWEPLTGSR
jgi:uncharacterized protein with NAD-binding domain and iron-sulfur cluster